MDASNGDAMGGELHFRPGVAGRRHCGQGRRGDDCQAGRRSAAQGDRGRSGRGSVELAGRCGRQGDREERGQGFGHARLREVHGSRSGRCRAQHRTVFDRAGRATDTIYLSDDGVTNIVEKWRTTTKYEGDRTTVIPPTGGTVSTTLTDTQGRTAELRQYTTAAGETGAYNSTKYTYNDKSALTKVEDTAGDVWTYKYDLLGRKTGLYDTSVSDANKRADFTHDTLYTGSMVRGQLTESTRYDLAADGTRQPYKWQARSFTARNQISGEHYIIPGRRDRTRRHVHLRAWLLVVLRDADQHHLPGRRRPHQRDRDHEVRPDHRPADVARLIRAARSPPACTTPAAAA
ncbi:hypothetical protein [Actinoplanes solisilvae]|uniref:hypothetical protein n=1 Tax=Actinoplanes solisilvae TaxID=2486853 RepID=UPI0013E3BA10|nr:hypothetical protein [Actinoplanes solisilvae]